jgi:transcription initiation factor TFIIIB Brf1 subunit/transcription initiation factor TFIIB
MGETLTDPEVMWLDSYREYVPIKCVMTAVLRKEMIRLEFLLFGKDEVIKERMMSRVIENRIHHRGLAEGLESDPDPEVQKIFFQNLRKWVSIREELRKRARRGER